MVALNVRIDPDLRRRLIIAKANTKKSMQELVIEFLSCGLAKVEKDRSAK